MRSHGITNFPDPTFPDNHFSLSIPSSIDTQSPQFTQVAQICTRLIPLGATRQPATARAVTGNAERVTLTQVKISTR
jgi:hypothetical protein